jgi:lipoprotein-anchoring transpeptidase ErfK/SrfK
MSKTVQTLSTIFILLLATHIPLSNASMKKADANIASKESAVTAEMSDDLEELASLADSTSDAENGSASDTANLLHFISSTERRNASLILEIHKDPGKKLLQSLAVLKNGKKLASFTVSTGDPDRVVKLEDGTLKRSSETPSGWFTIHGTDINAYSSTYHSHMPHALFFKEGAHTSLAFAIHGHHLVTGKRASGGCVRMHPEDAARVWAFVMAEGVDNTLVHIM